MCYATLELVVIATQSAETAVKTRRLPPATLALTNALPPLLCVLPPSLGVHPFPADVRGYLPGHLHIHWLTDETY